jgi:aromatic ring-opening dioxygenase catalytic subunit (LigB family)
MNSNKAKAVLFAVLLFAAGSAVGALGHRYYAANVANAAEDWRQKYIEEMQKKLKLNQHQVDQLQVILDETKQKFRAARESHHPEMVKIKDDQLTKVKALLSPDQARQYEAMVAEREQRAKEQDDHDRQDEARQRALHLKALNGQ